MSNLLTCLINFRDSDCSVMAPVVIALEAARLGETKK
jgi:hypothetical protein